VSFSTVEAAVQTLLQAVTGTFDRTADVTRGNFRVLDDGSAPYAVLMPGEFEKRPYGGARQEITLWTGYIWLFEKYVDDGTSYTSMEATREAVLDQLEKYPTLNFLTGIVKFRVSSGGEVTEVYDENKNGPFFLMQALKYEANEVTATSGGEYT
jgi:hypothetical protein